MKFSGFPADTTRQEHVLTAPKVVERDGATVTVHGLISMIIVSVCPKASSIGKVGLKLSQAQLKSDLTLIFCKFGFSKFGFEELVWWI